MTAPTDSELAYQLIGALEPLGAQWAQVESAVHPYAESRALIEAFGEQLAEIVRLARLEVAENERLRSLNAEMREALEYVPHLLLVAFGEYACAARHVLPPDDQRTYEVSFAAPAREFMQKVEAILAKTETPQ